MIDLTHEVEAGNVLQGAYHLRTSLPYLPEGSVTLAVVDPGVGSERFGLAAFWQGRFIIAPDNGLITMLPEPLKTWKLPPPESSAAPTFHGRDVFAVCAARLAVDPGWTSYLEPLESPVLIEEPKFLIEGNTLSCTVLHVDHFGNCILSIKTSDLLEFTPAALVTLEGDVPLAPVSAYHQAPADDSILFLKGSQGSYELALNGESAAEILNIQPGHRLTLTGQRSNS